MIFTYLTYLVHSRYLPYSPGALLNYLPGALLRYLPGKKKKKKSLIYVDIVGKCSYMLTKLQNDAVG